MSSSTPKKVGGKAKGTDPEDARRQRNDHTVQIRKNKQEALITKHRKVKSSAPQASQGYGGGGGGGGGGPGDASPVPGAPIAPVDIPALAHMLLTSQDPAVLLEATASFRKVLSVEKQPPIDAVVEVPGVVARFVELLCQDANPRLQFESCWALTNIASGTSDNTRAVVLAGAVPHFVRLLDSPSEDVREQAVWALGNIAGDTPAFRNLVLEAGIVPPLLRCLVPTAKESFIRNATWTISNLCRGKVFIPSVHKALLPRLASLVTTDDKEVLADSLWALSYLSDGEEDRMQCFLESGSLGRVVELLRHLNPDVITPALRTVGNVVTGDDLCTQSVLNEGALHPVAELLKSNRKPILKESCWLVSNVCAGTQAQIQAVCDANIIPLLIQCMEKGSPEVAKEACWALSNATMGGNPRQVWTLVQCGIIGPFHEALNRAGDSRIQIVALEGLENILDKPPPLGLDTPRDVYKKFMEEAGVPATLDKMLAHQAKIDASLWKKAEQMLERHWPHWNDYGGDEGDYGEGGEELEDGEAGGDDVGVGAQGLVGLGGFAPIAPGPMVLPGQGQQQQHHLVGGLQQQQQQLGGVGGFYAQGAQPMQQPPGFQPGGATGGGAGLAGTPHSETSG